MMSDKGKSIMEAIQYLDGFYNDLKLLLSNFENLLAEKEFISIPDAGNRATWEYALSNHIGSSNRWTLKCIQRLYLKEEETEENVNSINKAILCNIALYPTCAFEMPIFMCGVVSWDGNYTQNEIYNLWPTKKFAELVKLKNSWRLKNKQEVEEKSLIFKFMPLEKLRNIKDYTTFFVDMVKVESSKVLQEIVDALENLYDGSDEIVLSRDLVVESIPEKLMETWAKPIVVKEGE